MACDTACPVVFEKTSVFRSHRRPTLGGSGLIVVPSNTRTCSHVHTRVCTHTLSMGAVLRRALGNKAGDRRDRASVLLKMKLTFHSGGRR